jgi:hypothetical protein
LYIYKYIIPNNLFLVDDINKNNDTSTSKTSSIFKGKKNLLMNIIRKK